MTRTLVTIATLLSVLFGTGTFNVACWCGPCGPAAHEARIAPTQERDPGCERCCSKDPEPCGADPAGHHPEDRSPGERCPCLSWGGVPLTSHELPTGMALLKRLLESGPVLLLEAVAPAPTLAGATADTIRAGPPGRRDRTIRLQAWICVWTT